MFVVTFYLLFLVLFCNRECFVRVVTKRDAATLNPIIQQNVVSGSEIWSDKWGAYRGLSGK